MTSRPPYSGRRLADAAVLLAALVLPLFFLVPADNAFEPAKALLLRLLGLVALSGMVLAIWPWRWRRRRPLWPGDLAPPWSRRLLAALALAWLAGALSTLLSIAPWTSLLGSQSRAEGLVTDTALLALTLAAAWLASHPGGAARLAVMMAASVLPAGLYGLIQHFGLDPLPWAGDVAQRVVGPAGASPLFAAHMVMALPFAAWQAQCAWRAIAEDDGESGGSTGDGAGVDTAGAADANWPAQIRLALWIITVLVGAAALLLASSRGPLLGLAGGAAIAVLAQAARNGDRRLAGSAVALALAGFLCLVLLNLAPAAQLSPMTKLPVVGPVLNRLSTALHPEKDTGRVRLRLWEGSAAAVEWTQRHDIARFAVGYGPETMDRMWAPFYPPILAYDEPRGQVPDRAHNLVADLVITEGALGLIAALVLFAAGLAACLALAGVNSGGAWRRPALAWLAGGVLAAALVTAADHSRRLAGLAFGLGVLAAVALWLLMVTWRRGRRQPAEERPADWRPAGQRHAATPTPSAADLGTAPALIVGEQGLLMAGLVALVAHWIDLQVSFAVISTRLMFGFLIGLWIGMAYRRANPMGDEGKFGVDPDAGGDVGGPTLGPKLVSAVDPGAATGHPIAALRRPDAVLAMAGAGAVLVSDFGHFGLVGGGAPVAVFLIVAAVLGVGLLVLLTPGAVTEDLAEGRLALDRAAFRLGFGALALYAAVYVLLRRVGWQSEADAWPSVAAVAAWLGLWLAGLCVWHAARNGGARRTAGTADVSTLSTDSARPARTVGQVLRPYQYSVGRIVGLAAIAVLAWTVGAAPVLADVAAKEGARGWQQLVAGLRAKGQSARAESFLDRARDRYRLAARLAPWEPAYSLALAREEVERGDLLADRLERTLAQAGVHDVADEYAAELLAGEGRIQAGARDAAFAAGVAAAESAAGLAPRGAGPLPAVTKARALRVWADRTREAGRKAERLTLARQAYDAAIAAAPGWPELLDEAALTALLAGDPARALAFAKREIQLDEYYVRAWRTAASAYALQDDAASALDAYAHYFDDYRNAGDLVALRGQLATQTAMGRMADALATAQTIAQLAPDDAHAQADLAALLDAAGRRNDALAAAKRAAALDPADTAISALVARLEDGMAPAPTPATPALP